MMTSTVLEPASSYLGDARLAAAKDGGIVGPSEQTIKTEASRFATTIRDGGPQDAQKMFDSLGQSTAGGDARAIAGEANNALKEAGLGDRYLVSGYSDGSLRLTCTEAVPNSLRQEAKLSFYSPGEAPNAPNKTPSAEKLREEARRFAEEVGQSGNPEQSLRDCLDELKKMGADSTDVARPLNQALKQSGLDMSVLANSSGEVILNSYRTKSEVIAETTVASGSNESSSAAIEIASGSNEIASASNALPPASSEVTSAQHEFWQPSAESASSGDNIPLVSSIPEEDSAISSKSFGENGVAPHLINTRIIKEQVMIALRRLGSGPERARFLAINGILPDAARARTTEEDAPEAPDRSTTSGVQQQTDIAQAESVNEPESVRERSAVGNQPSSQSNDQRQAQDVAETEGPLGDRTFQIDGATIGIAIVYGKEVTKTVVRPDGSRTIYGDHDANGNPGSIEEYNPEAHEPFRTATRGENDVWTTLQGGKEFQKQGHLTVENGTHRFQTTDGTTFVRTPDGKASLEVAPKPDRVEQRGGATIEFRSVNGKEVTSSITYPNGFKAVYGGHDADGNPTSIKEYAKDSKQPFRTAKLTGDTWKIESPGRPPIELKGTLTVEDGIQTFDTVEAKFMRTASGSEKIEAKSKT